MDAADVLATASATGPFQRLLAASGRVRAAEVPAPGHGFVAAVLAHVLESPIVVLAHDPRAADAIA